MSNSLLIRALAIYGACVAIALFVGYDLASWDDQVNFRIILGVGGLMLLPLLLKWHHLWLIAVWNTTAVAYFIPGYPSAALFLTAVSLLISVLQHAINQEALLINVRTIVWPLIFMAVVVWVTARLTGGIGLSIAGSTNVGGKRYIYLLGAILGYFALAAQKIPLEKARRYAAVFFLSPATGAISDISLFFGPSLVYYIFLIFPSNGIWEPGAEVAGPNAIERFAGIGGACAALNIGLMALYGIRGIFNLQKPWRMALFFAALITSLVGGFRSVLVNQALVFAVLFCVEGLLSTGLLPVLVGIAVLVGAALFPFADSLPMSMQRTLSVVPFLKVSDDAASSAKASSDWREQMWLEVLPEVPRYLALGKGLSLNAKELARFNTPNMSDEEGAGAIYASDFHNGPLSVIIPFGLAGVIGFLWFIGAGIKVLYCNYKYGDPALERLNTFFLAIFIAKFIFFMAVFGSLYSDFAIFTGLLGLNVSINGGMRQPVRTLKRAGAPAWTPPDTQTAALN
jgi:hypothetical protein